MREVNLPSGAILKVAAAPFADAKALYQAMLAEMREIPVSLGVDMGVVIKDLFCAGMSSPIVDAAITKCVARCLYNGEKITTATFEPVEARADYVKVLAEVAKENVFPFMKSLFAEYKTAFEIQASFQKSTPPTTVS